MLAEVLVATEPPRRSNRATRVPARLDHSSSPAHFDPPRIPLHRTVSGSAISISAPVNVQSTPPASGGASAVREADQATKRGRKKRERSGDKGEGTSRGGSGSTSCSTSLHDRSPSTSPRTSSSLNASTSSAPLPSLLSHLSLSPVFYPTPSISVASGTFSFPIPDFSSRHSFPHLYPLSTRRPCTTLVDKRASPGPHPHLIERTKKRKLIHRFFRSEALLAGPSSPPPKTVPLPHPQLAKPSPTATSPSSAPRRPPPWWPSVSRSFGEGRESNLGPREGEWVGDGEGWQSRLEIMFETCLSVEEGGKGKGKSSVGSQKNEAEEPSRTSGGPPSRRGGTSMARTRASRSVSSPPAFPQSTPGTPLQSLTQHPNLPPAALKQHLLAVLRSRLASEGGGNSRGGEAGLRFKKWVVYNAWMKRTNVPTEGDGDVLDLSDDLDEDTDEDGPSWVSTVDSTLVNSALATLPLVHDAASALSLLSSSPSPSSSNTEVLMEIDPLDPPPLPLSPRQSGRELPTVAEQVRDDLPFALGVDSGESMLAEQFYEMGEAEFEREQVEPPTRPKIRRAFSLPRKFPSEHEEEEMLSPGEERCLGVGIRV